MFGTDPDEYTPQETEAERADRHRAAALDRRDRIAERGSTPPERITLEALLAAPTRVSQALVALAPPRPRLRVRVLNWIGRRFGYRSVDYEGGAVVYRADDQ